MRFETGGWEIDILVHGYPGRSTAHGGLGWSTIALLRGHGRVVVLDGGGHGQRGVLVAHLKERGLTPLDVTDLLLSHAHYDHCVNWPLFRQARIWIGRVELGWALGVPWGETPVPEYVVEALSRWPTLQLMDDGQEVMPGITAHLAPGHTPGHLLFVVHGEPQDVILLQDAVKNRAELVSRDTDMTYDPKISAATVAAVWDMIRRRPGSLLVPGHDLPMVVENGVPRALGAHRAAIRAWTGDDLKTTTLFPLAPGQDSRS
jgi:glyoxylase-like metal-dependent hydrolase (beta-lactamase superfamily II)